MAKAFQFAFLLQRAIDQRDEAAVAIGAAVKRLANSRERHAQVVQYRQEYLAKFESHARQGISVERWRDFQLFIEKLNAAIEQQMYEVTRSEANLAAAQSAWRECEREVKAYETLRDRHDEREIKREAKQEQKLSDEWASSMHRNGGHVR